MNAKTYRIVRYMTDGHETVVEDIQSRREANDLLSQIQYDREPSDYTSYGIEEYEVS